MDLEITCEVHASASRVWEVLVDIARWPEWSASMESVTPLDDGPLRVGSRARVKQPRLAPAVWTVTDLRPEVAFTWESKAPGITTVGTHELRSSRTAQVELALGLQQRGPLAGLIGFVAGPTIRRYVQMESQGLKRAAETASA